MKAIRHPAVAHVPAADRALRVEVLEERVVLPEGVGHPVGGEQEAAEQPVVLRGADGAVGAQAARSPPARRPCAGSSSAVKYVPA